MNNDFFEEIPEEQQSGNDTNSGNSPYGENPYSSYGAPYGQYQQMPPMRPNPQDTNGLAVASLVFGLISLFSCCCFLLSLPCAIISIILAVFSKKGYPMNGVAISGLITGIIGIVFTLAFLAYLIAVMNTPEFQEYYKNMMESLSSMEPYQIFRLFR